MASEKEASEESALEETALEETVVGLLKKKKMPSPVQAVR